MRTVQAVKTNVESKFPAFAIIIAGIAAVLYLPVLRADFVYDDVQQRVADAAGPYACLAITYDAMGMTAADEEAFRKAVSLNKRYASYDSIMPTLLLTSQQAKKLQAVADRVLAGQKAVIK